MTEQPDTPKRRHQSDEPPEWYDPIGARPRHRLRRELLSILALAAMGVVLMLLVFPLGGEADTGDDDQPATTTSTSTSTTTSTTSTSTTTTTEPSPIDFEPEGMRCTQIERAGYTFGEAFRYFQKFDQPEWMDPDADGIPCESNYDQEDIDAVMNWFESTATTAPAATEN